MVRLGQPLPPEILGSTGPRWSEMADFITDNRSQRLSRNTIAKQVQEVHYALSNEPDHRTLPLSPPNGAQKGKTADFRSKSHFD